MADVQTDFYQNPEVDIITYGGISAPISILESLVAKCCEILWPTLDCSDIGQAGFFDATSWIEAEFTPADAAELLTALRAQVTPGLNYDPNRHSLFVGMPWPQGGVK
jgi:hypothetical protein